MKPVLPDGTTGRPSEELARSESPIPAEYYTGLTTRSILYLAAHPNPAGGPSSVAFERGHVGGDHKAVVAFTSKEKLVEQLGEFQPWIGLSVFRVMQMLAGEAIVVDPEIAPGSLRWNAERLAKLEKEAGRAADV
jgi:hypothetical protein